MLCMHFCKSSMSLLRLCVECLHDGVWPIGSTGFYRFRHKAPTQDSAFMGSPGHCLHLLSCFLYSKSCNVGVCVCVHECMWVKWCMFVWWHRYISTTVLFVHTISVKLLDEKDNRLPIKHTHGKKIQSTEIRLCLCFLFSLYSHVTSHSSSRDFFLITTGIQAYMHCMNINQQMTCRVFHLSDDKAITSVRPRLVDIKLSLFHSKCT